MDEYRIAYDITSPTGIVTRYIAFRSQQPNMIFDALQENIERNISGAHKIRREGRYSATHMTEWEKQYDQEEV